MRMLTATALAAVAVMCASCGKSLNPEAQQAWDEFKTTASAVNNNDALQAFGSYEDYCAEVDKWKDAAKRIKEHMEEYPQEIVDSIDSIKGVTRAFRQKVSETFEAELKAMQNSADQDTIQNANQDEDEPKSEIKGDTKSEVKDDAKSDALGDDND